jgi:hypothetical protein
MRANANPTPFEINYSTAGVFGTSHDRPVGSPVTNG